MAPSSLKRAASPVYALNHSSSSLKRIRSTTTPPGQTICRFCKRGFSSIAGHLAQNAICGEKEVQAMQAHCESKSMKIGACGDSTYSKNQSFDEDSEYISPYDDGSGGHGMSVHSETDLPYMVVQEVDTTPLAETHFSDDDDKELAEEEKAEPSNNNASSSSTSLPFPSPSPSHNISPSPKPYEPAGKISFPSHRKAGCPIQINSTSPPDPKPTLYDKWEAEWDVHNQGSIYGPFKNEMEWEIAQWAKVKHIGKNDLNGLLSLPGV